MATWQEKFKSWEVQLTQSTHDTTSKCVLEIKQAVDTVCKKDGRATLVCKVLNLVCRVKNIKAGVELFTSLAKYIFENFWATFLQSFKYFIAVLISKKHWDEALAILPVIDTCELNDSTLQYIFYIYSTCGVSLILNKKVVESDFEFYSAQIAKVLRKARQNNAEEFLNLVSDLLGSNRNFQILMLKQVNGAATLLHFISSELSKCGNVTQTSDFGKKCCMLSLFLVSVDARNKTKFSVEFLKACLAVMKTNKDPSETKILINLLMLVAYLMKLLVDSEVEKFNKYLVETLDQLSKMFRLRKASEPWLGCGFHMVSSILMGYSPVLNLKMDNENISSIATLLETTFDVWQHTKHQLCLCSQTYCFECGDLVSHSFWNLLLTQAVTMRKAMQLQIKDGRFAKLYGKMMNEAVQSNKDVTCHVLKSIIQTAFWEGYKVIKQSIQSKLWADVSYESLKAWSRIECARELISESQRVFLYKYLLKMRGLHRDALEMHCLYVAHLLAAPDSKPETLLQEIALCSAGYAEANMDYELSICDILDNASLDFKVPAYNRKLATRLQLEASTKYAGIDTMLKTYLAKKVISETNDEVELANVLGVLGQISVAELKPKVEQSVKSLTKKLLVNRNDPSLHLALGRLLIRQYRFVLEVCKESANGKSFSEVLLHEEDLEYFEQFDICSENKINTVLVNAMNSFETFFKKVDPNAAGHEWNQIVEDISFLARHFSLRGYPAHAYTCWYLIHQVSVQHELKLPRIRSVSFFAEYSDIIQYIPNAIDLRTVINSTSNDLHSELHLLEKYTPRQQNYILLALINIAAYYQRENEPSNARLIAELAHDARNGLKDRENCTDLVNIQLLALNFNMFAHSIATEAGMLTGSPYAHLCSILEAIGKVKHITSEDSINLPTLLFRVIEELAYFTMYRLCASPIRPFLYSLMQCIAGFSLGCRMVEIVSILTAIDIQMERVDYSSMKLAVLNKLLGQDATRPVTKIPLGKPKTLLPYLENLDCEYLAVEQVRRKPTSPVNFKQPDFESNKTISTEYFRDHSSECNCGFCKNEYYLAFLFQVGCLHSQNQYISGDLLNGDTCLLDCIAWKNESWKPSPLIEYLSFHTIFCSYIYNVNNLRRFNRLSEAEDLIENARIFLKKHGKHQHSTYMHILAEMQLCLEDLMKTPVKAECVLNIQTPPAPLITPVKIRKIKNLQLAAFKAKKTNHKHSKQPANNNDEVNIVLNLINDWNLSDGEGKENQPNRENCIKSAVETKKPSARTKTTESPLIVDATPASSSNANSNKPKRNGRSTATSKVSSRKVNEGAQKSVKATLIVKPTQVVETRKSSRARKNQC